MVTKTIYEYRAFNLSWFGSIFIKFFQVRCLNFQNVLTKVDYTYLWILQRYRDSFCTLWNLLLQTSAIVGSSVTQLVTLICWCCHTKMIHYIKMSSVKEINKVDLERSKKKPKDSVAFATESLVWYVVRRSTTVPPTWVV